MTGRIALVVVAVAALGCAQANPTVADRVRQVETQVWSPYCPGRLLSECTTRQAHELRADIADRLRDGQTPDEVIAWFASNYGAENVARPPSGGRGLAVWLVPLAAALAGATVLVGALRKRPAADGPPSEPPTTPAPPTTPERIERLRDEVRRDL